MGHATKTAARQAGIIKNRQRLAELATATKNLSELCQVDSKRLDVALARVEDLESAVASVGNTVFYLYRRSLPGRWEAFKEWVTGNWRFVVTHVRGEKKGVDVVEIEDDETIYIDSEPELPIGDQDGDPELLPDITAVSVQDPEVLANQPETKLTVSKEVPDAK
jgi:hypothetical protein